MRNSQNHKKHVNYFLNGADYDINPELASAKEGFYRDARNMRLLTNRGAVRRINGEELTYYNKAKAYSCIGALEVNGNIVEVWVSDNVNESLGITGTVRFRINGTVMVETTTDKLKFVRTRKLQMDKADDCKEGLFFVTDNSDVPYIFSLKDIQDNYTAGTTKYTTSFNQNLYSVNLNIQPNIPVFRCLTSGTLDVGKYAYAIRFVDKDGNRTKFSIPTPMIPVPLSYKKGSNSHPYNSTHGGILKKSNYGIRIDFRINNKLNYEYVELLRIKSISLQALNEVQEAEFRPLTPILKDKEISVRTFIDDGSYTDWQPLTDEESTDTMAAIKRCKTLRYYNNQLVLANVEFASRDIQNQIRFTEYFGKKAFPFIDNLGEVGYYSPHNSAYKTSYMSGEKYGFGVACLDWQNNVAFVIPIYDNFIDLRNYKFPERREKLSGATYELSVNNWRGAPKAADINNDDNGGLGNYVHEKFSKATLKFKTDSTRQINNSNYLPYTPKIFDDVDSTGLDVKPNNRVCSKMKLSQIPAEYSNGEDFSTAPRLFYRPDFSLNYYGMGIAIAGIENLPDWVSAFCIVRTKPAGRVLCQGIATYYMTDSPQSPQNVVNNNKYNQILKSLSTISFFSDDIKSGYIGAYSSNFFAGKNKLQPVSPLGYFSELYGANESRCGTLSLHPYYKSLDIIIYARDFVTDNSYYETSPNLPDSNGLTHYWTKFGKWRNANTDTFVGTKTFGITTDVNENFKSVGQDGYVKITLDDKLYLHDKPQSLNMSLTSYMDCNNLNTQLWHEPFYIANIIDDNKNVPDINQQEYILTGHYQKIESIIGIGNDQPQSFILVDERFEDCCVNDNVLPTTTYRPAYIYMRYPNIGEDKAWVDITVCDNTPVNYAATVIAALQAAGEYISTDPITGKSVICYGVYTHTLSSNTVETGDWTINFEQIGTLDKKYCIPSDNSEIVVKYDSRFPLKVFGGDVTIGESVFALVDGLSDNNGDVKNNKQLYAWTGFPYSGYELNQVLDNSSSNNSNQKKQFIPANIYRQILVSSIVESRVHLPYAYQQKSDGTTYVRGNNFPRVHYIIRPIEWSTSNITTSNFGTGKINPQYLIDYPLEYTHWERGGFRSIQGYNRDYSKTNNYNRYFGKPQVGFEEKTCFCTRHIWSLKRNINVQDDPNIKTFISLNVFDISDRNGEVKYLYDNDSGKGNNLISITDSGICLLITDKRTISDINSNELFVLDSDSLIKGEYWLSKVVGSSGEFWRGIAEYNNTIFIPNSESIYMLSGLELKDILRYNKGSYYDKLHPVLQSVTNNIPMTAVFNIDNQEYWLYIGSAEITSIYDGSDTVGGVDSQIINPKKLSYGGKLDSVFVPRENTPKDYTGSTYVYKLDKDVFTGTFDYRGDKFICKQGSNTAKELAVLIMRNYETYTANSGTVINGAAIEAELEYNCSPEGHLHKEFIDATINSSICPTTVDLRTTGTLAEATQSYFKNYNGYYFQTPRKTVTGYRMQGKYIVLTIKNNVTGTFEVTSVEHGYKIIR